MWPAGRKVALSFSYLLVCSSPLTYHVRNIHIMYILAMRLYFSRLQTAALSTGVATMSTLAQLQVRDTKSRDRIDVVM